MTRVDYTDNTWTYVGIEISSGLTCGGEIYIKRRD
jgi:hypothetical protein